MTDWFNYTKFSDAVAAAQGNGGVSNTPVTLASLGSAATAGVGTRAFISDATTPTWGATAVGGGAVKAPVYSDGTNWKIG